MERINQFRLYELGCVVHPLAELDDDVGPTKLLRWLFDAREKLDECLSGDPSARLMVSQGAAGELRAKVDELIQTRFTDRRSRRLKTPGPGAEPVTSSELLPIRKAAADFEAVLRAEMESRAAFVASKRAGLRHG